MADITILGLLPAFSIGRIGCTVVSDHIGSMVDSANWYAFLAMDYPVHAVGGGGRVDYTDTLGPVANLAQTHMRGQVGDFTLTAWNLGLVELLWLIPVNALILWLGFRSTKRPNAGLLVVLTGVLYAPVRFFLDFLRPEETDPRYDGLTFAQWASILAFAVAGYVAWKIIQTGKPAKTITKTSGEAQAQLKVLLKETEAEEKEAPEPEVAAAPKKKKKKKKAAVSGVEGAAATSDASAVADDAAPEVPPTAPPND
jgi:prolipoprotein diacylglyceryltransferase